MLSIRDLVKIYPGPVTALDAVSLDAPPGMFGLLGPNGAGKTTLMKIVAGLLEATAGAVTLDGDDVLGTSSPPSGRWRPATRSRSVSTSTAATPTASARTAAGP